MVAGIEECSNSEFGVGPCGPLITAKPNKHQCIKEMKQKTLIDSTLYISDAQQYADVVAPCNQCQAN